jgi:hypothetical protein
MFAIGSLFDTALRLKKKVAVALAPSGMFALAQSRFVAGAFTLHHFLHI